MKNYLKLILFFSVCVINHVSSQNSPQLIIDDMTLPPDAALHGVPSYYSWASGKAQFNSTVPAKNNQGEWFRAMTSWGQVYIPIEGCQATNTRCQIRNVISKFLMNDGNWYTVQSGDPQGAAFVEDFANNVSIDAGIRDEAENGGGVSVIVGVGSWTGYNFHFWADVPRATVNIDSIAGVFTTCEARLIMDDTNKPDDRAICKNVLQMGGDWWLNQTIGWLPDWTANSGIGNGRSKWVTTEWQSFNFCTQPAPEILANPPISFNTINEPDSGAGLLIYPNPLRDGELTIKPNDIPSCFNIIIFNLKGVVLFAVTLNGDEAVTLGRNFFNPGSYIIQASGSSFVASKILIVE